jgi:N-acetylmuramoyl-L-alanine amidase
MLAFTVYLGKVIVCSFILFAYYLVALRNKGFHSFNRFYLLAATIASLVLPIISIEINHNYKAAPVAIFETLNTIQIDDAVAIFNNVEYTSSNFFNWEILILIIYALISFALLLRLIFSIVYFIRLKSKFDIEEVNGIAICKTENIAGTPFSFFNTIFWDSKSAVNTTDANTILAHENTHIAQKHSWDKLFIQIVISGFYLNPIFWLIKKELFMLHEFIADKKAINNGDAISFSKMILATVLPNNLFSTTNHFYFSPIKRRLAMITKNKNLGSNYITRITTIPLLFLQLTAFTFKLNNKNSTLKNTITVVLDAGHGGNDPGARSTDGLFEKDMSLELVKAIQAANKNEKINLVLTRDADLAINVKERALFAQQQKAALFVAIHIDAEPYNKFKRKSGLSVFVPNNEFATTEKSKVFASSIINIFNNNYNLPIEQQPAQRKAGIYVLNQTACPAILIEAGYITNKADVSYLQSDAGKATFAKNVLTAIEKYAAKQEAEKK